MPDLTGFPALDVAIGLAFLFFLLSTVCSAINEGIASVLGWRAANLEKAVARMLGGTGKKPPKTKKGQQAEPEAPALGDQIAGLVFDHWRIKALVKDPSSRWTRNKRPSYVPARAFSRALAEVVAGLPIDEETAGDNGKKLKVGASATPWERADHDLASAVNSMLANLPKGEVRAFLERATKIAGNDLERFRTEVEKAFDDTMERASGWYKRKIQLVLTLIAVGVTLVLNVDSVRVADTLWKNPAVRTSVAGAGVQAANKGETPKTVGDTVSKVNELNVPIGWGGGNAPAKGHVANGILRRIPGWIFTMIALSLGAPFWFDLLSRLARLRGSGPPVEPHAQSDQPPSPQSTTTVAAPPGPAGGTTI